MSPAPSVPPNPAFLSAEVESQERPASPFELGFRAGRTEGLISLIEAVASALSPEQTGPGGEAAEGLDGTMDAQTALGRGAGAAEGISSVLPLKTRPCVLVVDDDSFNLDLLEDTFEDDYDVVSASDGLSAIDIATEQVPDLILLDVMMPGVNGYEVLKRLKAQHRTCDIPVMFITGLGDLSAETRGLELGAVDYVTKPINPPSVRARVKNQIKLKWAMDKLVQVSGLEQTLRENLLDALEQKGELVYD